jgi:hypothetical protein
VFYNSNLLVIKKCVPGCFYTRTREDRNLILKAAEARARVEHGQYQTVRTDLLAPLDCSHCSSLHRRYALAARGDTGCINLCPLAPLSPGSYPQGQKRKADVIGNRILIDQIAIGEAEDVVGKPARAKSGATWAQSLTPEQRSEIASTAAQARWKKT